MRKGADVLTKRDRLEARISPEQKMLFQRAAALHGQSLSDYVVSTVQKAAEEALRDHEIMTLSARDSRIFVEALLNPPEPNDALRAAFMDYKEFTGQQ
jgi:uncharacterized protein (DUF1778 family)